MSLIDNIIFELSQKTGVKVPEIRTFVENWTEPLMQKGVVVRLEIKRWRALSSIEKEDIGFENEYDSEEEEDFISQYFQFGTKYLLPKRVINDLNRVDNAARQNLKEFGLETIWGYFIPCKVFMQWKERNEEIEKRYYELRDKLVGVYDSLVEEVCVEYRKLAKILWLKKGKYNISDESLEDLEQRILTKTRSSILSADSFKQSFGYNSLYLFIPMPSQIEKDLLDKKESTKQIELIELEKESRKQVLNEMSKKKSEYFDQFLTSTVGQIRSMILKVVNEVKKGIEVNESVAVHEKTKKKLLGMITKMRSLDFYDDSEVRKAMDHLQKDLEKDKEDRSEDEIKRSLLELEAAASGKISDLLLGRFNLLEL